MLEHYPIILSHDACFGVKMDSNRFRTDLRYSFVATDEWTLRNTDNIPESRAIPVIAELLRDADACLVMTEWPEFSGLNGAFDLMKSRVIIEGRRILTCDGKEGICW